MLFDTELHIFILHLVMHIMLAFGAMARGSEQLPSWTWRCWKRWAPQQGGADVEVRVCAQCLPLTCLLCFR